MADNRNKPDEIMDRNLARLGPELALPNDPTPLQRARWKQAPESPAEKGIRFMKRHKFFTIGSAIAATIGVSVLLVNLTAPQVSAAEILQGFKQAIGNSLLVTFKVIEPEEGVTVEGRLFARKPESASENDRHEDVYVQVRVTGSAEKGDWAGLDLHVEAALVPEDEWVYVKLDGLPTQLLQEQPMVAIFGAMVQNGIVLKLDGLTGELRHEIFGVKEEILEALEEVADEVSHAAATKARTGENQFEGLEPAHEELVRALKAVIKGEGTQDSLNRLITWIEENATETSIAEGRGGLHILTAEGFAGLVGEEEISPDERELLEDMTVEIAYTRKDGVQWVKLDVGELVSVKLDLANPAIDPDLFDVERHLKDGKTQMLDLSSMMNMFAPQLKQRSRADDS